MGIFQQRNHQWVFTLLVSHAFASFLCHSVVTHIVSLKKYSQVMLTRCHFHQAYSTISLSHISFSLLWFLCAGHCCTFWGFCHFLTHSIEKQHMMCISEGVALLAVMFISLHWWMWTLHLIMPCSSQCCWLQTKPPDFYNYRLKKASIIMLAIFGSVLDLHRT